MYSSLLDVQFTVIKCPILKTSKLESFVFLKYYSSSIIPSSYVATPSALIAVTTLCTIFSVTKESL